MRVNVLFENIYEIHELPGKKTGLTDFLEAQASRIPGTVAGMLVLIENVSKGPLGPKELGGDLCHPIDKKNGIYEFIKGQIRVLWFEDEGKVIVCTHAFLKKSPKTPKTEIEKARSIKTRYQNAKAQGRLKIEREEEEGDE